jgi:SlyX protein
MAKSDTDRLDELEILAAHQARLLEDLNETAVRQDKQIHRLEHILEALIERFRAVEENVQGEIPVTKPPHW